MELRKATLSDIDRIMPILDDARAFQRSMGFRQWEDGYPDRDTGLADIASGNARVLVDSDRAPDADAHILGYCLLAIGDPAYDCLNHSWLYPGPYGVIHRLALSSASRGRKLARLFIDLIERDYLRRGIHSLRVDTGAENLIMRHLLLSHGFHPHGLLHFPWGPRLTFEKHLRDLPLVSTPTTLPPDSQ